MSSRGRLRLRRWALFSAAVAGVASTLDLAYEISLFLQSRGCLAYTVRTLLAATGAVGAYSLIFGMRVRRPVHLLAVTAAAALFLAATLLTRSKPAERFHFLEYGALSLLALHAARVDLAAPRAGVVAFAVTTLAGLLDETLQGRTQVRYFDWTDVRTNALAALLALALFAVVEMCRRRETVSRERDLP